MTADFMFFVPSGELDSRFFSENPTLVSRVHAQTVATAELEDLANHINNEAERLEDHPAGLEGARVDGDRILRVSAAEHHPTLDYLIPLALERNLGLVDRSNNKVVLYGDEDPRYVLTLPDGDIPALSRAALVHNFDYVLASNDPFFVIEDTTAEQHFIQAACNDQDQLRWHVEYREGDDEHHFSTTVAGAAAITEVVCQWLDDSPHFADHAWTPVTF